MDDFKIWYNQQPLLSRSVFTILLVITALVSFGIMSPASISLDFEKIFYNFQLWRLFTNFFFIGTFSFNIIFTLFFIHFAFSRIESLYDKKTFADLLWLVLYTMLSLNVIGLTFKIPFLMSGLQITLIYIWCKRRPLEIVQFLFGLRVKSAYFPFVLVGFHLLVGENIFIDVVGLVIGHSYIFLKDILPVTKSKDFLRTPRFFTNFVNKNILQYNPAQTVLGHNQQQQQQQGQRFQAFQGRGVRIG